MRKHRSGALVGMAVFGVAATASAQEAPFSPLESGRFGAAPATAAATTTRALRMGAGGDGVALGFEVFGGYGLRVTTPEGAESSWFHAFALGRAHLAAQGRWGDGRGRVVLEALRSAGDGALVGVGGDSLVLRLREAYGAWARGAVEVRAGVVPTLVIPEVEGTWRLRAVAPTPLEATALAAPADLGATARVALPRGYGWAGLGVYNGEGYAQRELNRGKNTELAVLLRPLPRGALAPLSALVAYQLGSSGTGLSRADRLHAALLWQGEALRAGITWSYAWGVEDDSTRRSWLAEVFVRGAFGPYLRVGARLSLWQRDTRVETDHVTSVTATVGAQLAPPLEVYLAGQRVLPRDAAAQAVPGSNLWDLNLVSRVVF